MNEAEKLSKQIQKKKEAVEQTRKDIEELMSQLWASKGKKLFKKMSKFVFFKTFPKGNNSNIFSSGKSSWLVRGGASKGKDVADRRPKAVASSVVLLSACLDTLLQS